MCNLKLIWSLVKFHPLYLKNILSVLRDHQILCFTVSVLQFNKDGSLEFFFTFSLGGNLTLQHMHRNRLYNYMEDYCIDICPRVYLNEEELV